MTHKIFAFLALTITIFCGHASSVPPILPFPNSINCNEEGSFIIDSTASINCIDMELIPLTQQLQGVIKKHTGINPEISHINKGNIIVSLDSGLKNDEHYRLDIDNDRLILTGSTQEAIFRGIATLEQLFLHDLSDGNKNSLPAISIDDEPRFAYRALMLDPARHFLPADDVKRFIDLMAKYKFNVLQLHLTDDQGWRIRLDSHPELSSDQSYSKEEIADLIDYAESRFVVIVPEIDIPGHTSAFLYAYPELGCKHKQAEEIILGKTDNRMLCAANPKVYEIFKDIFAEMSTIFPSQYIHLGGDEAAIPKNWAQCEDCLALMAECGYSEPQQLMIPFFNNMLGFVRENGKKPILWCELNNIYPPADDYLFPYPDDVTLVTWRMGLTPTCLELTGKSGFPLIMAPGEFAYLDYPQLKGDLPEFNNWGMPVSPLTRTYNFDPGYGVSPEEQAHVLGIMGTLWGEAINDINRATYMAFPRALALSEAGWTNMDQRDWSSFKQRLYPNLYNLMKEGVSFRVPFEIAK